MGRQAAAGGGPIKRDKLWFFVNPRKYQTIAPVPGRLRQPQRRRRDEVDLREESERRSAVADSRAIESIRLTGQLTARNRVTFSHEHQHRCSGSSLSPSGEGCRAGESNWVGVGNLDLIA